MMESAGILLLTTCLGSGWPPQAPDQEFVAPDAPLSEAAAPSDEVTNGHAYEHGVLSLDEPGQELVMPVDAVIEEYDGDVLRVFLTKSMHCSGHPPHPMRIADARKHLGIACRYDEDQQAWYFSTFGEWANKGGSARIQLLVLVPSGMTVRTAEGLAGPESRASTAMRLDDPAMTSCYWYAGIGPAQGWTAIPTYLNYNRFVAP